MTLKIQHSFQPPLQSPGMGLLRGIVKAIAPSMAIATAAGIALFPLAIALPASAVEPLSEEAIGQRQAAIPDWTIEGQVLSCTYEFGNFVESVDFVNQIVEPAEALGHHPDLTISYSQVSIDLTTHDAGGLSALDFDLAEQISALSDRPCQS
ncbi:MAG: 4a-hydroxytetrahydrobiopterin dehydratase [Elainellaceae cyanobacterium]